MANSNLPQLNGCCGCFNLKTGTLIIGYFQMILAFLALVGVVSNTILGPQNATNKLEFLGETDEPKLPITEKEFYQYEFIQGSSCVLPLILGVLLIVGVERNKPTLFVPWLILESIVIIFHIMGIFSIFSLDLSGSMLFIMLLIACVLTGIQIYFFLVVFNFKQAMERLSEALLIIASVQDIKVV